MTNVFGYLDCHVTPRSGRDFVLGLDCSGDKPVARIKVRAVPEGGKANKAVCALIAHEFGLAKSQVKVVRGKTARYKRLAVEKSQEEIEAWKAGLNRL